MTPRFYDHKRNQNSYPKHHLLNLIICINNSNTNYRRHHFNYLRFFFSFHYLRYSAFSSFYRSHKIKLNGSLLLPTLEFLYLSPNVNAYTYELLFLETSCYLLKRSKHLLPIIEPNMKPLCHFILILILLLLLFYLGNITLPN